MNKPLTFDNMPETLGILLSKIEAIEELLSSQPVPKEESEIFLSIDEAAAFLHKSKPTLYRLTRERKFPVYKNGRQLLFKASELKEYLNRLRQKSTLEIQSEIR
jgi:excisionase family DNA binding protein